MTDTDLKGRVALVTGASRGIGAATAVALAGAGAHVILTARTEGGLVETDDAVAAAGGSATIAPLDVLDDGGIGRLAEAVAARWGRLDILVLNAAVLGSLTPVAAIPASELTKVFAVNLVAPQRFLAHFDPLLRAAPAGRVVALTSSAAGGTRPYWSAYAASKAALETMVGAYSEEVRNISPVRVALLDPGATRTAMRARAFPGEDPATLKGPDAVGEEIAALLLRGFETGARVRV